VAWGQSASVGKKQLWTGRIISALPGGMKLVKPAPVVDATVKLGYAESVIIGLGVVLVACTILYLLPPTSILGAILLTGYLGGAVATHVRIGDNLFSIFFPVILGVLSGEDFGCATTGCAHCFRAGEIRCNAARQRSLDCRFWGWPNDYPVGRIFFTNSI
jgi:hypothetical protein